MVRRETGLKMVGGGEAEEMAHLLLFSRTCVQFQHPHKAGNSEQSVTPASENPVSLLMRPFVVMCTQPHVRISYNQN